MAPDVQREHASLVETRTVLPQRMHSMLPLRRLSAPVGVLALAFLACDGAPNPDGSAPQGASASASALVPLVDAAHEPRPNYHDFGHIRDGEVATHVYRFRNAGTEPIAIERVVPSCGCAVPSIRSVAEDGTVVQGEPSSSDRRPLLSLPAGATLEIELRINTREVAQKNVDRLYTIRITTDAAGGYYQNLEAHIFVERPFEIVPAVLNFGRVPMSVGATGSVQVVQGPAFEVGVGDLLEASPGIAVEIRFEEILARKVWTVAARLDPPLEPGRYQGLIRLATRDPNGEAGHELSIPVIGEIIPDVVCEPSRLVFASPRQESAQMRARVKSLVPGHRFLVREGSMEEPHAGFFDVSFTAVEPDAAGKSGEWELVLATRPPLPDAEALLRGELRLLTDDPAYAELRVPYVVHLR